MNSFVKLICLSVAFTLSTGLKQDNKNKSSYVETCMTSSNWNELNDLYVTGSVLKDAWRDDIKGCSNAKLSTLPRNLGDYRTFSIQFVTTPIGNDNWVCFSNGKVKSTHFKKMLNSLGHPYNNDVYLSPTDLNGSAPPYCHVDKIRRGIIPERTRKMHAFGQCVFKPTLDETRPSTIEAMERKLQPIVDKGPTIKNFSFGRAVGSNGLFLIFVLLYLGVHVIDYMKLEEVIFIWALQRLFAVVVTCYVFITTSGYSAILCLLSSWFLITNQTHILNADACVNAGYIVVCIFTCCVVMTLLSPFYSMILYIFVCILVFLLNKYVAEAISFDMLRKTGAGGSITGLFITYSYYVINDFLQFVFETVEYDDWQIVVLEVARSMSAFGPFFGNAIGHSVRLSFLILRVLPNSTPPEVFTYGGLLLIVISVYITKCYFAYVMRSGQCILRTNDIYIHSLKDKFPAYAFIYSSKIGFPIVTTMSKEEKLLTFVAAALFMIRFVDIGAVSLLISLAILSGSYKLGGKIFLRTSNVVDNVHGLGKLVARRGEIPAEAIDTISHAGVGLLAKTKNLESTVPQSEVDFDNFVAGDLYSIRIGKQARSAMNRMSVAIVINKKYTGHIIVVGEKLVYSVLHLFAKNKFSLKDFKFSIGKENYNAVRVTIYNFVRIGDIDEAVVLMTLDNPIAIKGHALRVRAHPHEGLSACPTLGGLSLSTSCPCGLAILTQHLIRDGDSGSPVFGGIGDDLYLTSIVSASWCPPDDEEQFCIVLPLHCFDGFAGKAVTLEKDTAKRSFKEHFVWGDSNQFPELTADLLVKQSNAVAKEEKEDEVNDGGDEGKFQALSGEVAESLNILDVEATVTGAENARKGMTNLHALSNANIEPPDITDVWESDDETESVGSNGMKSVVLVLEALKMISDKISINDVATLVHSTISMSRTEIFVKGIECALSLSRSEVGYSEREVNYLPQEVRWFFGDMCRNPPRDCETRTAIEKLFTQMRNKWPTVCKACWKSVKYSGGTKPVCKDSACVEPYAFLLKKRDHGRI